MDLAELLALFPDNDTGEVSAADVRAMVTEFYNDIAAIDLSAVAALQADLDTLEGLVAALQTTVAGHTTTLGTQASQISGITSTLAQVVTDLGTLDGRVDTHDTQITSIIGVNDIQATQIAGLVSAIPTVEGNLTVTGLGGTGTGGTGTEDVCRSYGGSAPASILDGNPHSIRFVMASGEPSANLVDALKRVRFDPNSNPLGWVQGDNGISISGANMKNWVDSNTVRQVQYNVAGRYLQVLGFNDSLASPA